MTSVPSAARAVIIGGGIIGCSTAYHLAKLGWRDVVLLERHKLTSGSTWHAAGLVGQLRTSANITQLLKYSVELYAKLEQETGQATGWKMNGGLRLACNAERLTEIKRQATTAHSFGLEMHLLTPAEARKLWPAMAIDDVVGAAFLPTDGQANPADIAQALPAGLLSGSRPARSRRAGRRGLPRDRDQDQERAGHRRQHHGGRRGGRGRRQLRRPVGTRGWAAGRRVRAAAVRPTSISRH